MAYDKSSFWREGGFLPGLLVGAVLSLSGLGIFLSMSKPPVAAPVIVSAPTPCPPPVEVVRAPPGPAPLQPGQILDPAKYDDASCAKALASAGDVPNDVLYACANSNRLGVCHLTNSCPTCACESYARSERICDKGGCGPPLNGTGCVSASFYGRGNPLFECEGDQLAVGACMMRRLLAQGLCTKD